MLLVPDKPSKARFLKSASNRYMVAWVQNGIVYVVESYGDDDAAVRLAEQLT